MGRVTCRYNAAAAAALWDLWLAGLERMGAAAVLLLLCGAVGQGHHKWLPYAWAGPQAAALCHAAKSRMSWPAPTLTPFFLAALLLASAVTHASREGDTRIPACWPPPPPAGPVARKFFLKELHELKTDIFNQLIETGALPVRPGVKRLISEWGTAACGVPDLSWVVHSMWGA